MRTYLTASRAQEPPWRDDRPPRILGSTSESVDFTSIATATYGTEARKSIPGIFSVQSLWADDVGANGEVKYTGADNDRDPILVNMGGSVPTNVRTEQLP